MAYRILADENVKQATINYQSENLLEYVASQWL